ncbi:MAG TPA: hypothetical protein VFG58_10595 [Solirubrobacterales bacterium]|nr:hypothetical protein [Solirubrobacterales bacterium]
MRLDSDFMRGVLAQAMGTLLAALTLYLGGVLVGIFESASTGSLLFVGIIWALGISWLLRDWLRLESRKKQQKQDHYEALRIATPKDEWSVQAIFGRGMWDEMSEDDKAGSLYMFSDAGMRVRAMRAAESRESRSGRRSWRGHA